MIPQRFEPCDLLWAFFEQVEDPLSGVFRLVVPRDRSAAIDAKGSLIAIYTVLVLPCQSSIISACYLAKSLDCGFVFKKKRINSQIHYPIIYISMHDCISCRGGYPQSIVLCLKTGSVCVSEHPHNGHMRSSGCTITSKIKTPCFCLFFAGAWPSSSSLFWLRLCLLQATMTWKGRKELKQDNLGKQSCEPLL